MKNESNKILKVDGGYRCRAHKLLKSDEQYYRWSTCTVANVQVSVFLFFFFI